MTYITEHDADERYTDFLNEIHPMVTIGDLNYDPARVLKEVDPVAYQCGLNDWLDSEDLEIGTQEQVDSQEDDQEDDEEYDDGLCPDGCCDAMPSGM